MWLGQHQCAHWHNRKPECRGDKGSKGKVTPENVPRAQKSPFRVTSLQGTSSRALVSRARFHGLRGSVQFPSQGPWEAVTAVTATLQVGELSYREVTQLVSDGLGGRPAS